MKQNGEDIDYVFRNGRKSAHGVSAKAVAVHLESLRSKTGGELKTDDVVAAARNKRSPLHNFFNWSDSDAAKAYRRWQARELIASVKIVYRSSGGGEPKEVRAFVHLGETGNEHYVTTISLMSDKQNRQRVLADALKELESFRQRYAEFEEFFELFGAIGKTMRRLTREAEARAA